MKEQLISFETAKLAKEKGFDALCYDAFNSKGNLYSNGWCEYLYDNKVEIPFRSGVLESKDVLAPTQSLLAKWLREKHEIDILVQRSFSNGIKKYILTPCFHKPIVKGYRSVEKNNYEEALEIALFKALKYII